MQIAKKAEAFYEIVAATVRLLLPRPDPTACLPPASPAPMLSAWLGGSGLSRPQTPGLGFPLL
jgi:hypothetical protein